MNAQVGSPIAADAASGGRVTRSKGSKGRGFAKSATTNGSRHGKFNAAGERVNGIWMASAAQAERYRQLLELQEAGTIGNLRTEVPYDLAVNNALICRYRADFDYDFLDERGEPLFSIVEDVKGMVTPEFRLKEKLFNALHPVGLSVIHVKGKTKHPIRERNGLKGEGTGAGWMHRHWRGKLPHPSAEPYLSAIELKPVEERQP